MTRKVSAMYYTWDLRATSTAELSKLKPKNLLELRTSEVSTCSKAIAGGSSYSTSVSVAAVLFQLYMVSADFQI